MRKSAGSFLISSSCLPKLTRHMAAQNPDRIKYTKSILETLRLKRAPSQSELQRSKTLVQGIFKHADFADLKSRSDGTELLITQSSASMLHITVRRVGPSGIYRIKVT